MSEVKCGVSNGGENSNDGMPTKEEFEKYEKVRVSGMTNMWDVRTVQKICGLSRDKIISVIDNYEWLERLYPDVRK